MVGAAVFWKQAIHIGYFWSLGAKNESTFGKILQGYTRVTMRIDSEGGV